MLWTIILCSLGVIYLAYYLGMRFYTKRWHTTFAIFWLFAGGFHILVGAVFPFFIVPVQYLVIVCGLLLYLAIIGMAVFVLLGMRGKPEENMPYIIVLGAQVRGRRATESLRRRLIRALSYLEENPETIVVVSGGQGKGEDISEAQAMANYLRNRGVAPARIRMEELSTSTRENLQFSKQYVDDLWRPTGIVTNNFHVHRAVLLAEEEGYRKPIGMAASSNPVVFINYLVRECVALWFLYINRWMHQLRKRKK